MKILLIPIAAIIVLTIALCSGCTKIGPCIGMDPLGCEMYRWHIDANEDGIVDRYDSYMWTGKKMHLYRRVYVNEPECEHWR